MAQGCGSSACVVAILGRNSQRLVWINGSSSASPAWLATRVRKEVMGMFSWCQDSLQTSCVLIWSVVFPGGAGFQPTPEAAKMAALPELGSQRLSGNLAASL